MEVTNFLLSEDGLLAVASFPEGTVVVELLDFLKALHSTNFEIYPLTGFRSVPSSTKLIRAHYTVYEG